MDDLYFVIGLQSVLGKTAAGNQFLIHFHGDSPATEFQQLYELIHTGGFGDVPALSVNKNMHAVIFSLVMNNFCGHFTLRAEEKINSQKIEPHTLRLKASEGLGDKRLSRGHSQREERIARTVGSVFIGLRLCHLIDSNEQ